MRRLAPLLLALLCAGAGPRGTDTGPVTYHNIRYGLTFRLPESWRGFRVVHETWTADDEVDDRVTHRTNGPLLLLRHPKWTAARPIHDIPIMVYTRTQWVAEKRGKFFPHAGGMDDEIAHNSRYVFVFYSRAFISDPQEGAREGARIVEQNTRAHPHLRISSVH